MSQIRRNNNSTAAAVFDTAGVAASTIIRGPLHPASQGPLAPVAVSDTAAVVATQAPAAVSDTAAVPCLKTVFKYSSNNRPPHDVNSSALVYDKKRERRMAAALDRLKQIPANGKEIHDGLMKCWSNTLFRARIEDSLVQYYKGNTAGFASKSVSVAEDRDRRIDRRSERLQFECQNYHSKSTILAKPTPTTVSFGTATDHLVTKLPKRLGWKECKSHKPKQYTTRGKVSGPFLLTTTNEDWNGQQKLAEEDFKSNNLPSHPLPRVQGVAFKGEDRWEVQSDTPPQTQQQQQRPQPQRSEVQSDTPPQTQQQQQRPQPQRSEVQSDTPPQMQQQQATTTRSGRRQQPASASASSQPLRRSRRLAGHSAEEGTRRFSRIAKNAPVCYKKFF